MKLVRILSIVLLLAIAATACSPAATATQPPAAVPTQPPAPAPTQPAAPAPTQAAPAAPTAAAPSAPTEAATAAATAAPAVPTVIPTAVSAMPQFTTAYKGKLLFCTDFPYAPQEFYDDNGNPQGADIDLGKEIAKRLSLEPVFVNSVFDSIIAAVTGGKCDAIISAMNITPDRQKQVSMIPYFEAGQQFVALKGNPDNINGPMDLCGKSAAVESGTTEQYYLEGSDIYKDNGVTQACTKAGKQPVNVVVTQKDSDALQQLLAKKVVVYFTDSPVAANAILQNPDQFQLAGGVQNSAPEGINLPCSEKDCSTAAFSPLAQAIQFALKQMIDDGTYLKILDKWHLADGAVKQPF